MSEHEVELTSEERAKIVAAYWNTTRDHIHVERVVANIIAARLADAEARAEAAEAERDSAKTANTAVWVMADRASRKGYELDPDDVLEALRGDQ